ncbi:MAG: TetR/AcrR family transcriptional regulator [Candidatus Hydrogenedentes bacterium]|nr:TetR/AcrR family transcriptional regulator [Candidatus Hydrogenedentota bacterium]
MATSRDLWSEALAASQEKRPSNARERSRLDTRQRLMSAWIELVAQKAPHAVSIKDITDRAEVSVGSFYCHFKDKDALTEEVALDCFGKLVRELDRIPERLENDWDSRFEAAFGVLMDFAERYTNEFMFLWRLSSGETKEGREFLRLWRDFWEDRIVDVTQDFIDGRDLSPDVELSVAAHAVWGMGERVMSWWISHRDEVSRETVIRTMKRLVTQGLF